MTPSLAMYLMCILYRDGRRRWITRSVWHRAKRWAGCGVEADSEFSLTRAEHRNIGLISANTCHPDTFGTRFRALCRKAGVPVISMHNTRHTIASLLHGDGVAPATAAELPGHEVGTHQLVLREADRGRQVGSAARLGGLLAAGAEG